MVTRLSLGNDIAWLPQYLSTPHEEYRYVNQINQFNPLSPSDAYMRR